MIAKENLHVNQQYFSEYHTLGTTLGTKERSTLMHSCLICRLHKSIGWLIWKQLIFLRPQLTYLWPVSMRPQSFSATTKWMQGRSGAWVQTATQPSFISPALNALSQIEDGKWVEGGGGISKKHKKLIFLKENPLALMVNYLTEDNPSSLPIHLTLQTSFHATFFVWTSLPSVSIPPVTSLLNSSSKCCSLYVKALPLLHLHGTLVTCMIFTIINWKSHRFHGVCLQIGIRRFSVFHS